MKHKNLLPWIGAPLFYLVLGLFFFHDPILSNRIQVATDTLMNTPPWASAIPGPHKVRNPALSDQSVVFFPWHAYTKKCLMRGEIPLWTPHALGGVPYMGNLSTAIFYPLNLLLVLLPVTAFFWLQCVVKMALAGFFTYLFLRGLGLRFFPSLFGGTVYALSGYTVLWMISNLTSVSILFPAMLWATERYLDRRDTFSLGLVSLLLGLQFLGAHPETSLCVGASWLIYTLFRLQRKTGGLTRDGLKALSGFFTAGLLAVGMVLFQLWPFLEYLSRSWGLQIRNNLKAAQALHDRGDPLYTMQGMLILAALAALIAAAIVFFRKGRSKATAFTFGVLAAACIIAGLKAAECIGFAPHFLIQLFPDLYGTCLDGVKRPGGVPYPELNGGYAGVLALLLAIVAMFRYRRRSPVAIFSCLLLLSFGTVHAFPVIAQGVRSLPMFNLCRPGRILCITAFSISVLAAFGLEYLLAPHENATDCPRSALRPMDDQQPAIPLCRMRAVGCAMLIAVSVALWGGTLLDAGFIPLSTGARIPGPGETATATRINLSRPRPGQVLRPEEGLRIEGIAGSDVTRVRFSLDGWGLGETEFGTGGSDVDLSVSGRSFLHTSPARTEGEEILNWMTDGIHQLGIQVETTADTGAEIFSIPIQVHHARRLTAENIGVFIASLAVFALLLSRRARGRLKRAAALAMVITDLSLFGMQYNCTSEPETLFPETEVTDFLTEHNGVFRIFPENAILQPSTHYLYGYQTVRGYDGLEIPAFNQVVDLMKKDPMVDIYHFNSRTMDYESPVLDVLGIRYILSPDALDDIPGLERKLDGPLKVYENLQAMPRVFVVGRSLDVTAIPANLIEARRDLTPVMRADGLIENNETLTRNRFLELLFKNYALLEAPVRSGPGGEGTATLERYENERLAIRVSMKGKGWLIITDNYYPGWKAYVDGIETPIRRSLAFRAVPVEDGDHVVEMVYHPASFYAGAKISLACLAVVLLCMFLGFPKGNHEHRRTA